MKRLFLAILLMATLDACATGQRTAAGLAPLGPCPATSWRPEAPPPNASAKTSMVMLAIQEWNRFGRQTIYYPRSGEERIERLGLNEQQESDRVHDFWLSVDRPGLTGMDTDEPWSAAFISWDVQSAGVPRDQFCPDARHTVYIERLVTRERQPAPAFVARRLTERAPQVGDLICASRAGGRTTLDYLDRGPGHCDIVVGLRPDQLLAIGGNVHDSVTMSVFPLDAAGFLSPISARTFFTVIENRLP